MTSHLLQTPLHDRHVALGAKLADFGGWEMPIEYPGGGVLKEHTAVREAVGLFDVSHLGKMRVTGEGARDFVNSQFSNDLSRIDVGQAQYSMLCDESGGVVDDLIVYQRGDDDVFVAALGTSGKTYAEAFPDQKLASWITAHGAAGPSNSEQIGTRKLRNPP